MAQDPISATPIFVAAYELLHPESKSNTGMPPLTIKFVQYSTGSREWLFLPRFLGYNRHCIIIIMVKKVTHGRRRRPLVGCGGKHPPEPPSLDAYAFGVSISTPKACACSHGYRTSCTSNCLGPVFICPKPVSYTHLTLPTIYSV